MVDICGIFNFKNRRPSNYINHFPSLYGGSICDYDLQEIKFDCGDIFYVERKSCPSPYFNKTIHILNFGTAFINKNYGYIEQCSQKILQPSVLCDLYNKFNIEIVKYIKGNFVIIIYDNYKNELTLISSKLNTLPLFYYYKNNNFIFSSSIKAMLKFINIQPKLNEKALLEQAIFHYPLLDKTCFEDVLQLPPATILKIDKNGLEAKKYWQIEDLFCEERPIPEKDALLKCIELMKENLKLYTSYEKKFLLSLTAGFDSRTNLALIENDPKDFLCYSYGMPASRQIEIPLLISKKLGLNYKAVYLDKAFEKSYEKYALMALDFSDGSAPILRANFPYAFEQLNSFSKINITGLFGSEIIKCFHQANEQVSRETLDLFMNNDFDKSFDKAIRSVGKIGYIKQDVIDKYSQEIKDDFREYYIQRLKRFNNITKFYIFLLEEAVRKYFMQEIRIERYLVDTQTPYFDEEFLGLIFKTPFAGIYKGAGKRNIFSRRNSQLFYAKIIQEANPFLGDIITAKGYKPKDLLLHFYARIFKVGSVYLREKIRRKMKGNDTFNSGLWSKNMVEKYIHVIGNGDAIFTDKLLKDFTSGFHLKEDFRFFSIFSLRLWLHLLNNKEI